MPSTSRKIESPGTVLGDKYLVGHTLGEGGMAVVYEAVHVRLGTPVAVKVLDTEFAQQPEFVERFNREARAAATIESPHVAKVVDIGTLADGRPYLAMELLVGGHLRALVDRRGPLPVEMAADLVEQAARGLAAAHAMGIIHRDVKPENIVACELGPIAGDRALAKILDFGIAKDVRQQASRMTSAGQQMGSVMYMSPEQIRSSSNVDARTDLWALGCVLYELLTGEPPFIGDHQAVLAQILTDPHTPTRVRRPDVPIELEHIVSRALAKKPDERFFSAIEFADALLPLAPREPIRALVARIPPETLPKSRNVSDPQRMAPTQVGWSTSAEHRSSRSGLAIGLVLGLLAGLAAVAVLVVMPRLKPPPTPAAPAFTVPATSVTAPVEPPPAPSASTVELEPSSEPVTTPSASAARMPSTKRPPRPPPPASPGVLPRRF
jgi:serine/threonine-protein kinase